MTQQITNRSQMIYALTEVAELEHTLMCQYLFAGASLKTRLEEFSNKDRCHYQLELVREWKKQIYIVAREEMQHLTYAINLLISVGGSPVFARPNFPVLNRFYKRDDFEGLSMSLERFDLKAIDRFLEFEASPEMGKQKALKIIPEPNFYETLREFYISIKEGLTIEMFVDYKSQYDPLGEDDNEHIRVAYRKRINTLVKNVPDAHKLIDLIIEEGEGSDATDEMAHYNKFLKIKTAYEEELFIDPDFEPSRSVFSNPMTRIHDDLNSQLKDSVTVISKDIDHGIPHDLLQLFSGAYEVLLTWLAQVFDRHGTEKELRAIETLAFMPYMTEVFRPLMEILTRYPVQLAYKTGTLGAGFEVTSNTFLRPKPEITNKLTLERLEALNDLAHSLVSRINTQHGELKRSVADELEFVAGTIRLIKEEFGSRVEYGQQPKPNPTGSSNEDILFSETAGDKLSTEGFKTLELEFQGWVQCRLASDPDGAYETRGLTGNNFALSSEPDLDRVIRFQKPNTVSRPFCPEIGVQVTKASIVSMPFGVADNTDVSAFENATIDLLGSPKFEGRNHIVSEDGEPIDPFEISVSTTTGIKLRRAVIGSGELNNMTPKQRRGTGRYPKDLRLGKDAAAEYLKRIGIRTPHELLDKRIKDIEEAMLKIPQDKMHEKDAVHLKFRKDFLDITKRAANGEPVREGIRWKRFFFDAKYRHSISGDMKIESSQTPLPFEIVSPSAPGASKWTIDYNFGFFDSDALACYVYGSIKIPVNNR